MADQCGVGRRLRPQSSKISLSPEEDDYQDEESSYQDEEAFVQSLHDEEVDTGLQFSKGRKFFLTMHASMGLGPTEAEEGDKLVICPGGKVIYMLRSMLRPQGRYRYKLIGDW